MLEEILDETNQLDVGTKVKQVLSKTFFAMQLTLCFIEVAGI